MTKAQYNYTVLETLPKGAKGKATPSELYVRARAVQEVAERRLAMGDQLEQVKLLLGKALVLMDEFIIPWMTSEEIAMAERQVARAVDSVSVRHELDDLYDMVYSTSMACKVIWDDTSETDQYRLLFGYNPNARNI